MRSSVVLLGFLCACGFRSAAAPAGDDEPQVDAAVPVADGCSTFSSQLDTCTIAFKGDLMLSGTLAYNTDTHQLLVGGAMMPVPHVLISIGGSQVDAIFAHNVVLTDSTSLHAAGLLPFAIVASGNVTLGANVLIDVSAG